MKVLVVASTFPASDADPVPAFVRDQLIAIRRLRPDMQISVLAPHDRRSGTQKFARHPDYDEYRFHYFWPFTAERLAGRGIMPTLKSNPLYYLLVPFLFLGEFFALLMLSRKLKPDVIYAHWVTPQAIVSSWVSGLTGIPFVFTTHSSDVEVWRKLPVLGAHIARRCMKRARAFTAVSRRSMERVQSFFGLEEWRKVKERAAIIPMGVTLPPLRISGESAPRKTVLFLGRLVEKKGVQFLLPAYSGARARIGESRLVIAGDGPMRMQLERQVSELGLGGAVQFVGHVTGDEKFNLLVCADIQVVPSILTNSGDVEGLPVSLMEALAFGKICIATSESGADTVLSHGRDGYLIPQQDVTALRDTLITAANMDSTRRSMMESAARETARRFDWSTVARQHYDFLFRPFERDQ